MKSLIDEADNLTGAQEQFDPDFKVNVAIDELKLTIDNIKCF